MGRNRFVTPETVTLELSDGDWIEVKERLTYGEHKGLTASALSRTGVLGKDMGVDIDFQAYELSRLEMWLVDWSLCDAAGKRVPVSREAISALDVDTAEEIEEALKQHEDSRKNLVTPG